MEEKKGSKIAVPENAKSVKVSKFKSNLLNTTSSDSNISSSKAILGDIKEQTNIQPVVKDIITMSSNERGFPKPTKNLNLGKISPAVRTEPVKSLQSSVQFQDSVKDDEIDDYGENNLKQVLSMSPEEVEASVAQLSTMFSSKNLDFLRTRGAGLIAQKHDSNISTPQYSEDKGCIARDAHELEEKVKHAPPHIRRALQWTLDGDDQNSTTDEASSANLPKLTSSPRFDLQGCRIIHSGLKDGKSTPTSTTLSEWDEVLQKSFVGRWLSVNEIHSLAQLAISKFLDCGYVVELPAGDNETWIPELEHHEFEQGKPGYNLLEICEFLRSEVPSQRQIGNRIINGILWRRDAATSYEAYYSPSVSESSSHPSTSFDKYCCAYSEVVMITFEKLKLASQRLGLTEPNLIEMKRDISRLVTYCILKSFCNTDFPPELTSILVRNVVASSSTFYSRGATLSANTNGMQELQSLRSLLSFLWSKPEMKAFDFLLGLPGSGGWNGSCSVSRGFSLPALPMPHARRPEVSYSSHFMSCLFNASKVKEDIYLSETTDEAEKSRYGAANTPQEEYSLLCRWDRGTTIMTVGEWKVCRILRGSILGAIEFICDAVRSSEKGNFQWVNTPFILAVDIGSLALNILTAALRLSPATLKVVDSKLSEVPNTELFDEIFREVIQPLWPTISSWSNASYLLVQYITTSLENVSRETLSIQNFTMNMWRLIYEVCISHKEYCKWLIDRGMISFILTNIGMTSRYSFHSSAQQPSFYVYMLDVSSLTPKEIMSDVPLIWMMRCLRVSVGYHLGTHYLMELLAILQFNTLDRQEFENWMPHSWTIHLKTEFIMLLEEAAMSCSFLLATESISSSGRISGDIWKQMLNQSSYVSDLEELFNLSKVLIHISTLVVKWLCSCQADYFQKLTEDSNWYSITFLSSVAHFVATIYGCNNDTYSNDPAFGSESIGIYLLSTFFRGPGLLPAVCQCQLLNNLDRSTEFLVHKKMFLEANKIVQLCLLFFSTMENSNCNDDFLVSIATSSTFAFRRLFLTSLTYTDLLSDEGIQKHIMSWVAPRFQPRPPGVSDGLFALQSSSVHCSLSFINLQLLALLQRASKIDILSAYCIQILPDLLNTFPRLTYLLLQQIVLNILCSDQQFTYVDHHLIGEIMKSILKSGERKVTDSTGDNQIDEIELVETDPYFSGFLFLDTSILPFRKNFGISYHNSFTFLSEIPVNGIVGGIHPDWMYSCLNTLKGRYLSRWIRVLSKYFQAGLNESENSCKMMYWLCRLAVSDISTDISDDPEDLDPLSHTLEEYTTLMKIVIEKLWVESAAASKDPKHRPIYEYHCRIFCKEAGKSSSTPTMPATSASQTSKLRCWEETLSEIDGKISRIDSTGLHDLVGRLIEATSSQTHHSFVHSISLIPLLLPGFLPWNERIRLWNDLGIRLGMIHLLEHSNIMTEYLAAFLLPGLDSLKISVKDNGAIERAMMESLLNLRNYEEDKNLLIVRIALYSISRYIFYDILFNKESCSSISTNHMIQGGRSKLLFELITRSQQQQQNKLILQDILGLYSIIIQTENIFNNYNPTLSLQELSREILLVWNQERDSTINPNTMSLDTSNILVHRNSDSEILSLHDILEREIR